MQKRPVVTDEMISNACKVVAKRNQIGDPSLLEEHYEYHGMTGQALAFKLASKEGWEYGIEIDDKLIDELDSIYDIAEKELNGLVEQWYLENKNDLVILENGTKIKFKGSKGEIEEGVIRGIWQYGIAKYIVHDMTQTEDDKNGKLVNFEDVEKVE